MNRNPWGLTEKQCSIIDAYTRLGCMKLVVRELGGSLRTAESHMERVRHRMGVTRSVLAAVAWDRAGRAR